MKKNILIITICAVALSISSMAYSSEGAYVSAGFGTAIANDADLTEPIGTGTIDFDIGFAVRLAAGYAFAKTRLEGEIGYQKNNFNSMSVNVPGLGSGTTPIDGDGSNLSFLVNGYYDFKNNSRVTPFIGGGIGFARVDASAISIPGFGVLTTSADDTVFAYQVGTGFGIAVKGNASIDISYRYYATSDPDFGGTKAENSSHIIYVGTRFSF